MLWRSCCSIFVSRMHGVFQLFFQPRASLMALGGLLLFYSITVASTEVVIHSVGSKPLTAREKQRVNDAIERAIEGLKKTQLQNGSFGDGTPTKLHSGGLRYWPVACAVFPALAFLECGLPKNDSSVQKAARFVRENSAGLTRTYEISLALIFLDRLGSVDDRPLIRSLGTRLVAGQNTEGGWGYHCPLLTPAQEKKVQDAFANLRPEKNPKPILLKDPNAKLVPNQADNSNTQFAILALAKAKKYDLSLDYVFFQTERRFRSSQMPGGWDYYMRVYKNGGYGSMTCAGLLGLAAGRGFETDSTKVDENHKPNDPGIAWGLQALAFYLNDPSDFRAGAADPALGPKGKLNFYFLWSVERTAVVLNLQTIGGKDWYRWGVELILPNQNPDGSWSGRGNGSNAAVIDTSMALLFLKKSDLLPDLRETLQKRLTIVDPGPPDLKGAIDPKKKTGDKSDPKKGNKDSPGEKDMVKEPPLPADLGEVKVGQGNRVPLRVRGPGPYKITKIGGEDKEVLIDLPDGSKEVHELIVLLRPQKTGVLRRTLILVTDIPGRPEVAVEIKANVVQ